MPVRQSGFRAPSCNYWAGLSFHQNSIILSNLPKVPQLVNGRAVIQSQTAELLGHTPYHYAELLWMSLCYR